MFRFRNQQEAHWDAYIAARRVFKKGIRKAQQDSWKVFAEMASDPKSVSRLVKCIQQCQNEGIGLLSDAPTDGPEGTVSHLRDVHFLGNIPIQDLGRGNEYFG